MAERDHLPHRRLRSSATYEVTEQLAGTEHTATGSTSGIAGDIGLDRADPSAARLGEVVINVQQLTSDQALRDQRLQHDFLESQTFPLATYRSTIDGCRRRGRRPDLRRDGAR
ncbi:MAG: YceI family protein [Acidimicrobiales bacterium]